MSMLRKATRHMAPKSGSSCEPVRGKENCGRLTERESWGGMVVVVLMVVLAMMMMVTMKIIIRLTACAADASRPKRRVSVCV